MKAAVNKRLGAPELVIRMVRPRVAVSLLLFAIVGIATSGVSPEFNTHLLATFIIVGAWYINATSINDLADYEIDLINLKGSAERPLANQRISRKELTQLAVASAIVSIGVAAWLDWKILVCAVIALLLNFIYSVSPFKISHRGFLASILLPLGYVAFPYLTGVWSETGRFDAKTGLILIAMYISFIGRILLKDFRDVKGDAKFGKLTFLLRHGKRITCFVSGVSLTIGSILLAFSLHEVVFTFSLLIYLVCALGSLYLLNQFNSKPLEQIAISGAVRSATGATVTLLAVLTSQLEGRSLAIQRSMVLALLVLFVGWVLDSLAQSRRLVAK